MVFLLLFLTDRKILGLYYKTPGKKFYNFLRICQNNEQKIVQKYNYMVFVYVKDLSITNYSKKVINFCYRLTHGKDRIIETILKRKQ